jgi:hypothetical protein
VLQFQLKQSIIFFSQAAVSTDPVDRMTLVAAFAVSAYGYCTARAGHKPFNPLLGETFECIRDDKGFKYIAEQVHDFYKLQRYTSQVL